MARWGLFVGFGVVAVTTAATWGMAAPTATGSGPAEPGLSTYGDPRTMCAVEDARLPEISGAVAVDDGIVVANDKAATVFRVSGLCRVTGTLVWAGPKTKGATPLADRDVEDLAAGPDGTVWLVDSGGNRIERDQVSLLGVTPDGSSVELSFSYPSGTHDVEAALITQDLQLVLLTKERGTSTVYTARMPAPDPDADVTGPVRLTEVGTLTVRDWADPVVGDAGLYVTGAALSPDGRHVAVRTAAQVFEWTVDGTDIAADLVAGRPATMAYVEQRQGEAITYTPDGASLLALSEQLPSPVLVVDITRSAGTSGGAAAGVPRWGYGVLGGTGSALVLVLLVALWRRRRPVARSAAPPVSVPVPEQELVP